MVIGSPSASIASVSLTASFAARSGTVARAVLTGVRPAVRDKCRRPQAPPGPAAGECVEQEAADCEGFGHGRYSSSDEKRELAEVVKNESSLALARRDQNAYGP